MQGILLDRQVAIWRKVLVGSNYTDTRIKASTRCAIIPISALAMVSPYAYESTHLVWVDHWLVLRKEDQIRAGRRQSDAQGDILEAVYTINGVREYRLGIPQRAYYARELT